MQFLHLEDGQLPLNDGQVETSSFHDRYHFGRREVELGHLKVVVSWLL